MELSNKQKAWAIVGGIAVITAGAGYLVAVGLLEPFIFVLWPIMFWSWGKYVWLVYLNEMNEPMRLVDKALSKFNFTVKEIEWSEDKTKRRIIGKYQDQGFYIETCPGYCSVQITYLPWSEVDSADPNVPKLMEAVNNTNAEFSNLSVVITDPTDEGKRLVYTRANIILPSYQTAEILEQMLIDMLNSRISINRNLDRERPWMNKKKKVVGFNAYQQEEENTVVAAKGETSVKN